MDDERVKTLVNQLTFFSGKREMAIDEIAMIQPGLGRLMPEIGNRTWKLYYAAQALNWPNAHYQWKETRKLFEIGAFTRPKHEDSIEEYLRDHWAPLEDAIKAELEKQGQQEPSIAVARIVLNVIATKPRSRAASAERSSGRLPR